MASPEAILAEGLQTKEWFCPSISRVEAEDRLRNAEVGTFYIRSSSQKDCLALSYKSKDGPVIHSLIQKTAFGYKLPDDDTIFPLLMDLLKACKFLRNVTPSSENIVTNNNNGSKVTPTITAQTAVDDVHVAVLTDAFPDVKLSDIVKALKDGHNNVNAAIDILLIEQKIQKGTAGVGGQTNGTKKSPSSSSLSRTQSGDDEVSKILSPAMKNVNLTNPIISTFARYCNKPSSQDISETWMKLPIQLSESTLPGTLESNLHKILLNVTHPMGKKINAFAEEFNNNYKPPVPPSTAESRYVSAIQEIHNFINVLQNTISMKVADFRSTSGVQVVWRVITGVVFDRIYKSLFQLLLQHNLKQDLSKSEILTEMKSKTPAQMDVPPKFQTEHFSLSHPVTLLQSLPSIENMHEKFICLAQVCLGIQSSAAESYRKANLQTPPVINVDDLFPLFKYVICQAQIPYIFTELTLMKHFMPKFLCDGLEGFSLAAFDACLESLEQEKQRRNSFSDATIPRVSPDASRMASPFSNHQFTLSPVSKTVSSENLSLGGNIRPIETNITSPKQPSPSSFPPALQSPTSPTGLSPLNNSGKSLNRSGSVENKGLNRSLSGEKPKLGQRVQLEELQKIEKTYVAALKQMKTSVDSRNKLASHYNNKGNFAKAIHHCKEALAIDPTNMIAQNNLTTFMKNFSTQFSNVDDRSSDTS